MINTLKMLKVMLLGATIFMVFLGCGTSTSTTGTQNLNIVMYGKYAAPSGADGDAEPKSMTISFTGASLVESATSTEAIDLYSGAAISSKIISRPQIIYSKDMSDLDIESFTKITLTYSTAVTAVGNIDDSLSATLAAGTHELSEEVDIVTGQDLRLEVQVNWKDIITTDSNSETMIAPTFTLDWVE